MRPGIPWRRSMPCDIGATGRPLDGQVRSRPDGLAVGRGAGGLVCVDVMVPTPAAIVGREPRSPAGRGAGGTGCERCPHLLGRPVGQHSHCAGRCSRPDREHVDHALRCKLRRACSTAGKYRHAVATSSRPTLEGFPPPIPEGWWFTGKAFALPIERDDGDSRWRATLGPLCHPQRLGILLPRRVSLVRN